MNIYKTNNQFKKYFSISMLLIIYRFLLDFSYEQVAISFEYQGLFLNNKTNLSNIYSWAIFIFFIPFCIKLFSRNRLSNLVSIILVIFSLIPTTVAIGFRSDYEPYYVFLIIMYWIMFFLGFYMIRPIVFRSIFKSIKFLPYFIVVLCISTVLIYSFLRTGFRLHFDIINVYDIRAEARGYSVIFPMNYILSFADNALPFFMIFFIHKRKYFFSLIVMLSIFVNFSITGTKQIIFISLCGLIGYYLIKNKDDWYRILVAAILLISFSLLELFFLETILLTGLFSYRVLFIPTELHFSYFNFFQINEIDLYRQSLLKFFFDSPYDVNIQFLMGEYSIGDITARANNGLFSDAYLNLGSLGVLIYPFLLVLLLRIFDGVVLKLNHRLWFLLAIYIGFVLLGMTLSTALFTAGFLPFLMILHLFCDND